MGDNDFFETVGTQAIPSNGSIGYAQPMPAGLPIEHRLGAAGGPASAWAQADNAFFGVVSAHERLPAGTYRCEHSQIHGPVLLRQKIDTDSLLRLSDSVIDDVLLEIERFRGMKARFAALGLLHKRGVLLWGPPGCISSTSLIKYESRGPEGRRRSKKTCHIERLYQAFHRIRGAGKGRYQVAPDDSSYWVSSVDHLGNVLKNRVVDVVYSGVKPCWKLRTRSGLDIQATGDHRFLSGGNYVPLAELAVGSPVETHRNILNEQPGRIHRPDRKMCYVKNHPYARTKMVNGKYRYHVLPMSRAVMEAHANELSLTAYLERLNANDLTGMNFLPPFLDVHHVDENTLNDDFGNLMLVSHAEHARMHGRKDRRLRYRTTTDVVESITYAGELDTYDIQMDDPYHNFIADRFVVHNSGKTAAVHLVSAMIVGREGGVAIFVDHPRLAADCLQLVRRIEPERPILAILEDLDALTQRFGENEFLALLDGEAQVNNVTFIATTNYPERLDRRFVDRPSRFDTVRFVGMPTAEARREFLAGKVPTLANGHLGDYVRLTEGMSLAHLRELIVLTQCYGYGLEESVARLRAMMKAKPDSDRLPGLLGAGFGLDDPTAPAT